MLLFKTVMKFITGSNKYFDIYNCKIDEVSRFVSSSGKEMIEVKVGEKQYKGLFNKWVYDYLCEHEGTDSFVVLWRAPKGEPMLAYVKEVWKEHTENIYNVEVSPDVEAYANNSDSFVYMWINIETDKKYIGKHKGKPEDGYICSSEEMLNEYTSNPEKFIRTILAYGSDMEMHELETMLILQLKATKSPAYYNMSNNLRLH